VNSIIIDLIREMRATIVLLVVASFLVSLSSEAPCAFGYTMVVLVMLIIGVTKIRYAAKNH
jgi:uncharacterized membrane protein YdbT with pleckstrin-like domain